MLEGKMQAPERIYGVSQSQFSIARYYGGCKAYSETYHYDANTDSLVRMDIWRQHDSSLYSDQMPHLQKLQNIKAAQPDLWQKGTGHVFGNQQQKAQEEQ